MASLYEILVKLDTSGVVQGSNKANAALDKTKNSAKDAESALKKAFAIIGIGAAVKSLIGLSNTYQNMQNRLRLVTRGTENLSFVTKKLFEVANKTRSSFQGTAELFTRVSLSTAHLGRSQAQTLQFTKSLNQAIILSGATARESHAGLIQFSQGLASGALRGDELRSVLEQLPGVADVLSEGLGVTRGELRLMGEEGKLTAEKVFEAFEKLREELEEKFGKVVFTLAQEWERFNNKLLESLGTIDATIGVSRIFAGVIAILADNMHILIPAVTTVVFLLGVQFATKAIPAAIKAITALSAAMAANPFVRAGIIIAAFIAILSQFEEEYAEVTELVIKWLKLMHEAFGHFFGAIVTIVRKAVEIIGALMDIFVSDAMRSAREVRALARAAQQDALLLRQEAAIADQIRADQRKKSVRDLKDRLDAARTRQAIRNAEARGTSLAGASIKDEPRATYRDPARNPYTDPIASGIFEGAVFGKSPYNQTYTKPAIDPFPINTIDQRITSGDTEFNQGDPNYPTGTKFVPPSSDLDGSSIQNFNDGGSIKIGGSGGIDQNVLSVNDKVVARVSRGETIEVRPNAKNSNSGGGDTYRDGDVVNITMNVSTPDVAGFNRSAGQIQANMRAAQFRASARNN